MVGVPLIQLVEVDHLRGPIGEANVTQGGDGSPAVFGVLDGAVAEKQAEVLGVIPGQRLLVIRQVENLVGEIRLPVVDQGVDIPRFLFRFHHVRGVRVVRLNCPRLAGAGERVEVAFSCSQKLLQILQGNLGPAFLLGGAVLANEGVGVAGHREGLDDLIVVPARGGKVLGGTGLRIGNTLGQNFVDGGGDAVHIPGDGVAVVENRLAWCSAAGQPAENQSRQHQHKQYREKKNYRHRRQQLLPVLSHR